MASFLPRRPHHDPAAQRRLCGRTLKRKLAHAGKRLSSALKRFTERTLGRRAHAALKSGLEAWFTEARKAHWKNAADVKRLYATASIVSSDRVVFNIKGNDYRLVVALDYEKGIVWIKWIGTHAEYDLIDVRTGSYFGIANESFRDPQPSPRSLY